MAKVVDYRTVEHQAARPDGAGRPWRWHGRGMLLALMLVLPVLGALAYAGPAWAVVLYRVLADGGAMLVWLSAATGIGLLLLWAAGFAERESPVLKFVTAAGLGLGILALAVLGLGLAGWLNRGSVIALLAVGFLMGGAALWGRNVGLAAREWLQAPAGWEWLGLMATPFLALVLVGAMVPPGMLWTPQEPHGYDVVEYHLQVPREWYEAGRIIPLRHNVFSYFPFNVEVHYLLAMHLRGGPWAGMYLAQLMHGAFVVLTVLAVYAFARRGAGPPGAMIATLAAASVPWLSQLAPIAYDEGGFLLFGTLSIGWALAALAEEKHRVRRFALAGMMAGFACGSKLTAVPEVLLFVPICTAGVAVWSVLRRRGAASNVGATDSSATGGRVWIGIISFLLMGSLCFAPWLVRNWAWARNPVFPEAMPLLGSGHFSPDQVQRFEHAHKAAEAMRSPGARALALWTEVAVGWQFGYLLLPLGIAGLAVSARRPDSWLLAGMLLLLAVFWTGFTHLQGRFLVLAIPISALLAARIEWRGLAWGGVALVLVFGIVGWAQVHTRLAALLYGSGSGPRHTGLIQMADNGQALGNEDLGYLTPEAVEGLPSNATLILVGEAKAFWYQIPMSHLRYKTVFDADTSDGRGMVDAWAGPGAGRRGAWLLIEPEELKRFARTYPPIPAVPPEIARESKPYVVKP
jgi:Dolichyl-phosphate-mannose-protein mannosyltransferase